MSRVVAQLPRRRQAKTAASTTESLRSVSPEGQLLLAVIQVRADPHIRTAEDADALAKKWHNRHLCLWQQGKAKRPDARLAATMAVAAHHVARQIEADQGPVTSGGGDG